LAQAGGGAALVAAAELGHEISAVVSRGDRPDLGADALSPVKAPKLLMVGGQDGAVIELNEQAFARLNCEKELRIIPGATHLFEEPGTLVELARLGAGCFRRHFQTRAMYAPT
jgi:pimeloyl-ACP methyl ester carboxylesterase